MTAALSAAAPDAAPAPTGAPDPDPDAHAREALRLLGPAPDDWVPAHAGIDHAVAIVGGGQSGTAFAFALRRAGIGGTTVIDAAADPSQAGVWTTRARMRQLRTPKTLVGPELGATGLGFQAWYEARHGTAAYAALDRIPRTAWADYLAWFRTFLRIPVRYRTRLLRIEPVVARDAAPAHFRLHLEVDGQPRTETARKLILANGVAGNGAPFLTAALRGLPADRLAHTAQAIDFAALRGRTVAVVGAAASAFDAAATALEAGAAAVHLVSRRPALAATPVGKVRAYPGAYDNFPALPDALRWAVALRYRRAGSTAPADSIARALAFPQFHLHLGAPVTGARVEDGRVVLATGGADDAAEGADGALPPVDFVIAGTGYAIDPAARPELAEIAGSIRRWRDQYTPPADAQDAELGAHPYLGAGHEYLEKTPGTAPWLRDIHVYNPAGFVSFGLPIGDVPSMRRDIPSVVRRISRDLVLADLPLHAQRLAAEVPPDFGPELYARAVWRGAPVDAG